MFRNLSRQLRQQYVSQSWNRNLSMFSLKQYFSTTPKDTEKLFIAISDLTQFNVNLRFPRLVSIGPQSSGKSSLLEALCGYDILPKGMGMATMKPISLTTIKSDNPRFKVGDKETDSIIIAREEINRMNFNHHIKTVNVIVWSPDVYNCEYFDLPGLFYVSQDDPELPKKILDMTINHIKDPNNIPVVISAASTDPATNQSLQLVSEFNRVQDTLGIITKTDLTKRQNTNIIEKMLKGDLYKLGNGWIPVVLRNSSDIDNGVTVAEKIEAEEKYFANNTKFKPSGVPEVRKRISNIQYEKIKLNIPKLIEDIDREVHNLAESHTFLENLIHDPNNKLSFKLKLMIEKLVGSSLERADFENTLKNDFKIAISEFMVLPIEYKPFKESSASINKYLLNYQSSIQSNPSNYTIDTFKELFSFGLVSPILVNNNTVKNAYFNETQLASTLGFYDLQVNDPMGKKRLEWSKYLHRYFSSLLSNDHIQDMIYNITEKNILDYIYDDPNCNDELTKRFAEYIIKEIGSDAYNENIRFSITAMIKTEMRPNVSSYEICRHLNQYHRSYLHFTGDFFETFYPRSKIHCEVYSAEWNDAYLKAVSEKLADNIYRNVAVNLLDNMVEKLLEMTIDMFNKEHALKEKNKVNDKITKLKNLRKIIFEYM